MTKEVELQVRAGCRSLKNHGSFLFFSEGLVYECPGNILHYVDVHGYRPPAAFCDAVMNTPAPDSHEYHQLIENAFAREHDERKKLSRRLSWRWTNAKMRFKRALRRGK